MLLMTTIVNIKSVFLYMRKNVKLILVITF